MYIKTILIGCVCLFIAFLFHFSFLCLSLGGLVFMLLALVVAYHYNPQTPNRMRESIYVYGIGFLFLYVASLFMLHSYIYPSEKIFRNVAYHSIEHIGYQFNQHFYLFNREYPDSSLLSEINTTGFVKLRHQNKKNEIAIRSFRQPIYVANMASNEKKEFELLNIQQAIPFENRLSFYKNNILLFSFEVIEPSTLVERKEKHKYYILSYPTKNGTRYDTASFNRRINSGINFEEILADHKDSLDRHSAGLKFSDCQIIRKKVGSPLSKQKASEETIYYFFPSTQFSQSVLDITADEKTQNLEVQADEKKDELNLEERLSYTDTTYKIQDTVALFIGLGKKQSEVFFLANPKKDSLTARLTFAMPKRYPLRDTLGQGDNINKINTGQPYTIQYRQFISSNANEIMRYNSIEKETDGGFYFNYFESDSNIYHISANVRYSVGTSKDKMIFEVDDNVGIRNHVNYNSDIVGANQIFALETRGNPAQNNEADTEETKSTPSKIATKSTANTNWLFQFKDQRAASPIHITDIIFFLSLFLAFVAFRLLILPKYMQPSRIELAIYVVAYLFMLFRSVIQWRIATFYPLEDISYTHYNVIVRGMYSNFWVDGINSSIIGSTVGSVSIFFVSWFLYIVFAAKINATQFLNRWTIWFVLMVSLLLIIASSFTGNDTIERVANLFVPLLLYYILDKQLLQLTRSYIIGLRHANIDIQKWLFWGINVVIGGITIAMLSAIYKLGFKKELFWIMSYLMVALVFVLSFFYQQIRRWLLSSNNNKFRAIIWGGAWLTFSYFIAFLIVNGIKQDNKLVYPIYVIAAISVGLSFWLDSGFRNVWKYSLLFLMSFLYFSLPYILCWEEEYLVKTYTLIPYTPLFSMAFVALAILGFVPFLKNNISTFLLWLSGFTMLCLSIAIIHSAEVLFNQELVSDWYIYLKNVGLYSVFTFIIVNIQGILGRVIDFAPYNHFRQELGVIWGMNYTFTTKFVESLSAFFEMMVGSDLYKNITLARYLLLGLVTLYLMIKDPGFSIMFLLYVYCHLLVVPAALNNRQQRVDLSFIIIRGRPLILNIPHLLIYAFCLGGFGIFIFLQEHFISFILEVSYFYKIIFGGVIALGGLIWIGMQFRRKLLWLTKIKPLGVVILLSYIFIFSGVIVNQVLITKFADKNSYIKYRAAILHTDISQLILNQSSTSDEDVLDTKDIRQIQQSGHNQWFINHYLKKANEKKHYFSLQSHFKQGVSYITQASDVVVTRYLIAEHGEHFVGSLLLLLLFLPILFFASVGNLKDIKLQAICRIFILLFVTATFVWMTVTNRFTFFGQDFPLIPAASKITLLITFGLWLLFLIHYEPDTYEKKGKILHVTPLSMIDISPVALKLAGFVALIAFMYFSFHFGKVNSVFANSEYYNITKVIDKVENALKNTNDRLLSYQQQDSSSNSLTYLLRDFHQLSEQDSITANDISVTDSTQYIRTLYHKFIKNKNKRRDPDELIHARKRNGLYTLAVNRKYYFLSPPSTEDMRWQGDLNAANTTLNVGLINLRNGEVADKKIANTHKACISDMLDLIMNKKNNHCYQNIKIAVLPVGWVIPALNKKRSDRTYLIRRTGTGVADPNKAFFEIKNEERHHNSDRFCFVSTGSDIQASDSNKLANKAYWKKNRDRAVVLKNQDEITLDYPKQVATKGKQQDVGTSCRKVLHRLRFSKENPYYLAKNIWINGHKRLFYPLGRQFNWSYNYANLVQTQTETDMRPHKGKNDTLFKAIRDRGITLSIDYKLTEAVYQSILNLQGGAKNKNKKDTIVIKKDTKNKNKEDIYNIQSYWWDFMDEDLAGKKDNNNIFKLKNINDKWEIKYDNTKEKEETQLSSKDEKDLKRINNALSKVRKGNMPDNDWNDRINSLILENLDKGFDASVVAIDGYGRIRLMIDYDKEFIADPNNISEYYKFLNQIYQNSTTSTEQDYFGNQAIMRNTNGMGSSFKPIVYGAVTSEVKLDWANWRLQPLDEHQEYPYILKSDGNLYYYAGAAALNWSNSPKSEFINNDNGLEVKSFLPKSNNIYHSSIFFLGSYPLKDLREHLEDRVLEPGKGGKDNIQHYFPLIKYNGLKSFRLPQDKTTFSQQAWPRFDEETSALAQGLYHNFGIIVNSDQRQGANVLNSNYVAIRHSSKDSLYQNAAKNKNNFFYWSFPESSDFLQKDRENTPRAIDGFQNPALGGNPVRMSPLKMAEAALRLFTLNRAINAHLADNKDSLTDNDYLLFDYHDKWSQKELFEHFKQHIFEPMSKTMTSEGTGKALASFASGYSNEARKKKGEALYFYCKTGTTSTQKSKIRHKRLMVIISNQEMHKLSYTEFENAQALNRLKLYSIFMTFDNLGEEDTDEQSFNWKRYAEPILKNIINSETFQNYMSNTKIIN